MSSSIDSLRNNIQDKDTQLVDSILQDMKQNKQPQQMNREPELTPEQEKELYLRQQQELEYQQKMMHQQMMEQQQQEQQQPSMITNDTTDNFIEDLKKESKYIVLVVFLGLLLNLDMVNQLFKSTKSSIFVNLESNELTIQSSLVKALLMGVIFYVIKTFLI
tara:strand:- start:1 stop:486 length:486 start_codon:yes stop_codon:yes gene_type:complete